MRVRGPVAVASPSAGAMSLGLQGVSVNCLTIAAVSFQFNKGIMCSYKVSLLLSATCFWVHAAASPSTSPALLLCMSLLAADRGAEGAWSWGSKAQLCNPCR